MISTISYRIIITLINTKEVLTRVQEKWGSLSNLVNRCESSWNRLIPLTIRDQDGTILPAVLGKNKLIGKFDAQLELTTSGFVGTKEFPTTPPKRVGFRFTQHTVYLVSWPVLNRVYSTTPRIDPIITAVRTFTINFLFPDKQWHDYWPIIGNDPNLLPLALKLNIELLSGEKVERVWAL